MQVHENAKCFTNARMLAEMGMKPFLKLCIVGNKRRGKRQF